MRLEIGFRGDRELVASIHERTRPHLTASFEEFKKVFDFNSVSSKSLSESLHSIGSSFVSFYKDYVLQGNITPPLAYSTIKAKLRKRRRYPYTPLVDTGEMINSIYYEVTS